MTPRRLGKRAAGSAWGAVVTAFSANDVTLVLSSAPSRPYADRVPKRKHSPRCIVIAGPNGAGKTTFAHRYLPEDARVIHFVNADLIAAGLSPLKPELAAIRAGRLVLREIDRLAAERVDFASRSCT